MKTIQIIGITLGLLLTTATTARSDSKPLQLGGNLPQDPITFNGTSGGNKKTNCGLIPSTANHIIQVNSQIDYMRIVVKAETGDPTLLIEGPGGRFCIVANKKPVTLAQMSGVWLTGEYKIYVGDRQAGNHPYTIYFTQNPRANF